MANVFDERWSITRDVPGANFLLHPPAQPITESPAKGAAKYDAKPSGVVAAKLAP